MLRRSSLPFVHEARCAIFRISTGMVDAKTVAITNSRF
jgi:hypothetical protein